MFQPISRIMASILMAFTAPLLAAVDTSSAPPPQPADQPSQPQVEMQQPQPPQPQVAPTGQQPNQNPPTQQTPPPPNWSQNQGEDQGKVLMPQYGGRFMFGQPPQRPQDNFQDNGMMEQNSQQGPDQQDRQKQMDEQQQKMEQRQQQMAASRAKATARMLDRQSKMLKSRVASLAKRGLHLSVECQQGISVIDDLSSKLKSATNSDDIDSLMQDIQDTGDTIGSCMMQAQQITVIPNITKMVTSAFAKLKKNKVDITDLQDEYNSDILPLINNVKSGTATDDDIDNLFSSLDDFRSNVEAAFSDNDIPLPNMSLGQPSHPQGGEQRLPPAPQNQQQGQ